MKKRVVEYLAMVNNHNLYHGDKLIVDWSTHLYESYDGDVIVLVTESTAIGCLHYVEKPTKEEIEELEKSWLDFIS
jgi:intracellular sulfur oxidation DsrE/DsrF family protein